METKIVQFRVSGMACGGCLSRVKGVLEPHAEIVEITLDPAIARLTNPSVDIHKLNELLAKIGEYRLSELVS